MTLDEKIGQMCELTIDVITDASAGEEFRLDEAALTPDVRRLRAFEKIDLKPGETKSVALRIAAQDLSFVGADNHWRLEAGDFRATVGTEAQLFRCTETKRWDMPNK
ncbi:MAG: fibronectin type III-like domain-contianing protein [Bacteroidaceae bacterium]|nr:fibronectin type III-like domain-contianing protein [Bacteroidaceae bacterium]